MSWTTAKFSGGPELAILAKAWVGGSKGKCTWQDVGLRLAEKQREDGSGRSTGVNKGTQVEQVGRILREGTKSILSGISGLYNFRTFEVNPVGKVLTKLESTEVLFKLT